MERTDSLEVMIGRPEPREEEELLPLHPTPCSSQLTAPCSPSHPAPCSPLADTYSPMGADLILHREMVEKMESYVPPGYIFMDRE